MNIIVLTGNEVRHKYFRIKLASDSRFNVLLTVCEGTEESLEKRTLSNPQSSEIEKQHVASRKQSEIDFFQKVIDSTIDNSNSQIIKKGDINKEHIVNKIIGLEPDILVCYGSSIIKSDLLKKFSKRFLNVHLGLSPYYRGSGTNTWPLINNEPGLVGATFMFIDAGIDTGEIIHQIQAEIFLGDSPHTIGNRLIENMTNVYSDIISKFYSLTDEIQPVDKGRLYFQKDFNKESCELLYFNFRNKMISDYLTNFDKSKMPYLVQNKGLIS